MIALVKLLVVFAAVIIALNRRTDVGAVLLAGAAALSLLMGRAPVALALDAWSAATSVETLRLVVIVLILTLTEALKAARRMESMVQSLLELITDARVVLAMVPALAGFLPMLGGALFSAPMVAEVGRHFQVSNNQKAFANYGFRHIWEYIMPLYPALVLCSTLLAIPLGAFTRNQWPLTVAAVIAGWIVVRARFRKNDSDVPHPHRQRSLWNLAQSIGPVLLVVIATMVLNVDLLITLPVVLVILGVAARFSWAQIRGVLRKGLDWHIALVLVGAMVFKQVMDSTGVVEQVSATLAAAGIPPLAMVVAIPFIVGLAMGVTTAAFSIGVPVVMPFLYLGGSLHLPYVLLMYAGGMTGLMLSPVHLCLILTRDYFDDFGRMMAPVLFSQALVLTTGVGIALAF